MNKSDKYAVLMAIIKSNYPNKTIKDFKDKEDMFVYRKEKYSICDLAKENNVLENIEKIITIKDLPKTTLSYTSDNERKKLLEFIKVANKVIDDSVITKEDFFNSIKLMEKLEKYISKN